MLVVTAIAAAQLPTSPTPSDIYTVAGGGSGSMLNSNDLPATSFALYGATAVTTDAAGNLYVANSDGQNASLVNIVYNGGAVPGLLSAVTSDLHPGNSYVVAGVQQTGSGWKICTNSSLPCGNGGLATEALLNYAQGLFVDSKGNLYISDSGDNAVRKVDTTGIITSIAGVMNASSGGYNGDGRDATTALLNYPGAVYADADGNVFIADTANGLIRVIYEGQNGEHVPALLQAALGPGVQPQTGFIYTVMGNTALTTQCNNNMSATNCALAWPDSVWLDAQGNAYVYDAAGFVLSSYVVYKVDATTAKVSIYAGRLGVQCTSGSNCGDNGPATGAELAYPWAAKLAPDGKSLYIVDQGSVRKVDANGIITTVAGTTNSTGTYSGDAGSATNALLSFPVDLAFDTGGNLYIADDGGPTVREVYRETAGLLTFTADSQTITYSSPINLTYATTGLFPGDSITTPPTVTTTATQGSQPDTYPITFTGQTSVAVTTPIGAPNPPYIYQFVDGTLNITGGAAQTIPPLNLVSSYGYGQAAVPLPATASSGLPITYTITSQIGPASIGGTANNPTLLITGASTNPVTLTASQAGNQNYAAAQTLTASFTVAKAPLTVAANNVSLDYGIYNPSNVVNQLTYTMSGFVENPATGVYDTQPTATTGGATVGTTAQSSSPAGTTWPITISQGNLGAANYYFPTGNNFTGATLTITGAPDYAVMADPTSLTMLSGQLRSINVVIAPRGGYKGTITLSCGSLPTNVGCIWSQQTVSIDGTGVVDGYAVNGKQVMLTIYVGTPPTTPTTSSLNSGHRNGRSFPAWPLASFGLAAAVLGAGRKQLPKKMKLSCFVIIAMVVLAVGSAVSCGGSSSSKNGSGIQPGTSTIQILGTDTATGKTNSLPITVTIQ
jgi:hypothetical protein